MPANYHGRILRRYRPAFISGNGPYAVVFECYASGFYGEPFVVLFMNRNDAEGYLAVENGHGCKYCGSSTPGGESGFHILLDLRTVAERANDMLLAALPEGGVAANAFDSWFTATGLSRAVFDKALARLVADGRIVLGDETSYHLVAD